MSSDWVFAGKHLCLTCRHWHPLANEPTRQFAIEGECHSDRIGDRVHVHVERVRRSFELSTNPDFGCVFWRMFEELTSEKPQ